jgi:hypothetical protein
MCQCIAATTAIAPKIRCSFVEAERDRTTADPRRPGAQRDVE